MMNWIDDWRVMRRTFVMAAIFAVAVLLFRLWFDLPWLDRGATAVETPPAAKASDPYTPTRLEWACVAFNSHAPACKHYGWYSCVNNPDDGSVTLSVRMRKGDLDRYEYVKEMIGEKLSRQLELYGLGDVPIRYKLVTMDD